MSLQAENFIKDFESTLGIASGAIRPESTLSTIGELDSLGWLKLMSMLDTRYGVILKPEDINGFSTVSDMWNYVERSGGRRRD